MNEYNNCETLLLNFLCKHLLITQTKTLDATNIQIFIDLLERMLMEASRRLRKSEAAVGRIPWPKVVLARTRQPVKALRSQ